MFICYSTNIVINFYGNVILLHLIINWQISNQPSEDKLINTDLYCINISESYIWCGICDLSVTALVDIFVFDDVTHVVVRISRAKHC